VAVSIASTSAGDISATAVLSSPAILPAAPTITSGPSLTPGSVYITVTVQSSELGHASCLALIPSSGLPTDGSFGSGFNATLSASKSVSINITSLQGNTDYSVFCYLENLGVGMNMSDVAASRTETTTTVMCPPNAILKFSNVSSPNIQASESTIQQGGLSLVVTLSCEVFQPSADLAALVANITASSNATQLTGFATRVIAASSASRITLQTSSGAVCASSAYCTVATFSLPAAPGYEITMEEVISVRVPGRLLADSGKVNSQQDIVATPALQLSIAAGVARVATESTFPNSGAGGADRLQVGGTTVVLLLVDDYFVQPVSTGCLAGLLARMVGSSAQSSAWNSQKSAISLANLTVSGSAAAMSACNPPNCPALHITMPAMPGYSVLVSETVTVGIASACVASGQHYDGVATRVIMPRNSCPTGSGLFQGVECSSHGSCQQDGAFCKCTDGWRGLACETSCGKAKCTSSTSCPSSATCADTYNVGSWYNGYSLT